MRERTGARTFTRRFRARDRYRAGEDRRHDPAAGEGVRGWDRQAPGGLAHAAEGVRGRSRHREAAPRWPATAARQVTAPRFTSERTSSLLGKAVHGALAVIHLRWSARSPGRRAFAPGVAVNTCPVAPGRAG